MRYEFVVMMKIEQPPEDMTYSEKFRWRSKKIEEARQRLVHLLDIFQEEVTIYPGGNKTRVPSPNFIVITKNKAVLDYLKNIAERNNLLIVEESHGT